MGVLRSLSSSRPARRLLPFAVGALVLSLGTVGWAKGHKKKPDATAGAATTAKPAPAAAPATNASRPKTGTGKKKPSKKGAPGATDKKRERKLRPEVAAIIRADNYTHQGYGVVEGELADPVSGNKCPGSMAMVDERFCVDRFEGTLVEVSGASESPWSPFEMPQEGRTYRAVSSAGVMPQAYISGAQAQAACLQAGKRLCKPVEWRTACMGPKKQIWGYSASHKDNACNDHGRSPMLHFYPQVNTSWKLVGMTEMNDPQL